MYLSLSLSKLCYFSITIYVYLYLIQNLPHLTTLARSFAHSNTFFWWVVCWRLFYLVPLIITLGIGFSSTVGKGLEHAHFGWREQKGAGGGLTDYLGERARESIEGAEGK